MTEFELKSLIKLGGRHWKKEGMHRIYFNNHKEILKLKIIAREGKFLQGSFIGGRLNEKRYKQIKNQIKNAIIFMMLI